jgi:hypothetical protein
MAELKMPNFGRAKGELITSVGVEDIKWMIGALQKRVDEDPEGRFADDNRRWISGAKTELKRRDAGGTQLAKGPATNAATNIQRAPTAPVSLGASMNDPGAVTEHLTRLAASHHIVSATTTVDCLPPACGVAVSYVLVNPSTDKKGPGEVYALGGGKVGLSGTTLSKIGNAAGVDWDPDKSGRLDNGSDPHYCHYRAVGYVRNFDGSKRTIDGEVEIDARDGSPQLDEITAKAKAGDRDPASQILELRKFLLRHAESKAKNRAVASGCGLRRSYHPEELQKPFAVCRLMFTGQSDDPAERKMFAEKTADAMIGGMASMYGKPPTQPAPAAHVAHSAPQRFDTTNVPQFAGHAPPPVGPALKEIEDFGDEGSGGEEGPAAEAKPKTAAGATATPVPNGQPAKTKPNYAEGEADL